MEGFPPGRAATGAGEWGRYTAKKGFTVALTWEDLSINFDHLDRNDILETWQWLVSPEMSPILLSSVGDAFLQNAGDGSISWLNAGTGELQSIADGSAQFDALLKDRERVRELFLMPLVSALKQAGVLLKPGQVYGYKKLPVLGGKYEVSNFAPLDILQHFGFTGHIHEQIAKLPDGTQVKLTVT